MIKFIESNSNKYFKLIKSLFSKKHRDEMSMFVVEGLRFVNEIPDDYDIEFYAFSETFYKKSDTENYKKRAEILVFKDELFKALSKTETPQGILAVCHKKSFCLKEVLNDNGFYIIADKVNDPGNLGTIIRTADAANVTAVFITKGSVSVYNDKVLRATMGSVFHIPVIEDVDIFEMIQFLKENNIKIYAAHLKGVKTPYELNLKDFSVAFLIGNEANGLDDEVSDCADEFIKIPILGKAESLNASVAASVLMYEVVRQRF